jgi:hypothetical protein
MNNVLLHEIRTEVNVEADPRRVWAVLMAFADYPNWNPFIRSLQGMAQPGETLRAVMQPQNGKAMSFRPKVVTLRTGSEFRWRGRLLLPGLLDAEHYFLVARGTATSTRLIHGETFTGLLVPLLRSVLESSTRSSFDAMNAALKAKVEAEASGRHSLS